ncbi:MAG TPA: response regulator [Ferrovibrio sp.]|uniref:response regulator transcription factor n=1 Tax=Ferrovibrio sp. TaxID=1917215 RepID=UPI002ED0E1BC
MDVSSPKAVIGVIDDDELVRDSLKALLETRHYAVIDFGSGREFLDTEASGKAGGRGGIACLLLDIHMPDMTGMELLTLLRRRGDRTPVILITGRGDAALQSQAQALGAPLLDKPVASPALFAAIEKALA